MTWGQDQLLKKYISYSPPVNLVVLVEDGKTSLRTKYDYDVVVCEDERFVAVVMELVVVEQRAAAANNSQWWWPLAAIAADAVNSRSSTSSSYTYQNPELCILYYYDVSHEFPLRHFLCNVYWCC